jgi:hypothetical protein
MDVAQLIVQQLVNERGVNDEWDATVNMAFPGNPQTFAVKVDMDTVLLTQFERLAKQRWKNHVKVTLNGGATLHPQHVGPIVATFNTTFGGAGATYPDGPIRFANPATPALTDHVLITAPGWPVSWDGVPKEMKLRLAFKTMFIHMVRDGFVMPGEADDQVMRITFRDGDMWIAPVA